MPYKLVGDYINSDLKALWSNWEIDGRVKNIPINTIFWWTFQKYAVKTHNAIMSGISKLMHYGILTNMPYW